METAPEGPRVLDFTLGGSLGQQSWGTIRQGSSAGVQLMGWEALAHLAGKFSMNQWSRLKSSNTGLSFVHLGAQFMCHVEQGFIQSDLRGALVPKLRSLHYFT